MAGSYQPEDDGIFAINVTPLVDVMLVLLVIFMVTAPAIAKRGLAFEEPETVAGSPVDSDLDITIDRNHILYVNGEQVAGTDAVRAAAARVHADHPDVKAYIRADRLVPHGEVMELVDAVQLAGVHKFALASTRKVDHEQ